MENKDQLNQIPDDFENETQDEKTSQLEDISAEATSSNEQDKDLLSNTEPVEITEKIAPETSAESSDQEELTTFIEPQAEIVPPEPIEKEVEPITDILENKGDDAIEIDKAQDDVVEQVVAEKVEEVKKDEIVEMAQDTKEEVTDVDKEAKVVVEDDQLDIEPKDDEDIDDEDLEQEDEADDIKLNFEEMSREELISNLETFVNEEDITSVKSKIALIKVAFLQKTKEFKESSYQERLNETEDKEEKQKIEPLVDDLETKFNELFDIYRQKRAIYTENLEKEKVDNLKKKQDILEKLKDLINSEETLKKTYDEFRELQEEWRNIGMVPKLEVNNLWQNYHFLVEKFFDKVKINKELKDLDLKKNLEQKIELCEKVEELLLEPSIIKSFRELQRLHEQWKEIGPVPDDKKDEIWERFKSTTDKINQRRRDHYKQLQEEQEANLAAKVALCEKADSLLAKEATSVKAWQERTRQFNDLFKMWKSIGPAPKKQNDEIWERFKTSIDAFYTEKKEHFSKIKDQQINNYNLKLELCLQAEALKDSDDWRKSSRELIDLQKQWKEIGPVPRKHAEKIWQRFRGACDEFFNRKSAHFSGIRIKEAENLKLKEELIASVENHNFGTDRAENLEVLKEYQREWTEIGFVPFKEKDRLQNAFRNAINKRLDQLNISNSEIMLSTFMSRIDNIKGTAEGNRQLQREQTFLQNKINQLREEIMLWENNIGFLADTKNANIVKSDFEKKIEKAKSELSAMEAKLKYLTK
ncbi:MAG: DUF349 domain-containing protein [Bacteroidales bacterium]|jgi:hypothetical protein|nr:DUF349 domain-containing protein [Bacteroidales bacterium]MDI9593157.1 DUF349 domain-containing protein [Bacteroidota bacterium]HOF81292.1 DUF349 domain-containing protein [Bacteroidales bacterium]HOR76531.1 DUF349 domain-containing protein [Bacteroidales bacterium]HPL12012.1 DUF349 domain-containing protein [Bacteroidales bacterium]